VERSSGTDSPGEPERKEAHVRRLLIGGALGIVLISLAACTSASGSEATEALQQKADFWEIDQIERNFHEATTKKNIDQMMSLYAPSATLTAGPGLTAAGTDEIRRFWLEKSVAFAPETEWISDHPAYKVEITVEGDLGTLHFECHYIGVKTERIALATSADFDVARIDGRWLITNMVAGSTTLTP
jgi:ketosteroid isomerase-like protein